MSLIVWIGASTTSDYPIFGLGKEDLRFNESASKDTKLREEELDWRGYEWSVPDVDKSLKRALWGMEAVSSNSTCDLC